MCIYSFSDMQKNTYIGNKHAYMHVGLRTHTGAHIHKHIHQQTHTRTNTYIHTYSPKHMNYSIPVLYLHCILSRDHHLSQYCLSASDISYYLPPFVVRNTNPSLHTTHTLVFNIIWLSYSDLLFIVGFFGTSVGIAVDRRSAGRLATM